MRRGAATARLALSVVAALAAVAVAVSLPTAADATPAPPPAFNAVSCPSVARCVAVGGPGSVVVSTDGGVRWRRTAVPADRFLFGVSCPTVTRCVAVGDDGTALLSTDGGARWQRVATGVTVPLSAVTCPTPERCYAVGDADTVIASVDGGLRWRLQQFKVLGVVYGVACSTDVECTAATSQATANLLTTDGTEWSTVGVPFGPLDVLFPMNGVACSGATCITVGQRGLLARSLTAGANWTAGTSGTGATLEAVTCPSPSACLAVGASGTVLATSDAGALWSARPAPTPQTLLSVSCPTAETCVAVGSGGTIVTTADGGDRWTRRMGAVPAGAPTVVLVVGDSFAHTLVVGLARQAPAYGLDLIDASTDGCSLARGTPALIGGRSYPVTGPCAPTGGGWPAMDAADVASDHPAVVLLVLGPWDLSTRMVDGQWETPGQPAYDAWYATLLGQAIGILSSGGARVVVTTVPEIRSSGPDPCVPPPATAPVCPSEPERVAALKTIARTVVARTPGVTLLDLSGRLSPHGVYARIVDGVAARSVDGVHLTLAGDEWLAPWLLPQVAAVR